jgi:predicted ATPase
MYFKKINILLSFAKLMDRIPPYGSYTFRKSRSNSMKVKALHIKKFKGISNLSIDFDKNVTVLIGENGTGKTTILEQVNLSAGRVY